MLTFRQLGRYGRFTNGMFQIAGVIGIAERHGYLWAFPEWKNYDHRDRFGSSEDIEVQKYFVNPLPVLEDPTRFPEIFIHWGFNPGPYPDNVSICGHLQSPKYFSHCIDTVRHYFRMNGEGPQNDLCAIHWRAGDYEESLTAYHPRQPKSYYEQAMRNFPPDQQYLVFSDNLDLAKQMFSGDQFTFSEGNNYLEDFKRMKMCKHFIGANSSFSLMAAVLGEHPDKKMVFPSLWFGPVAGITGRDCYPENAIVI